MRNNLRTLFLSIMILLFCSVAYGADYVENEVIVLTRDSNMTGSALSAAAREGSAAKAAALAKSVGAVSRRSYPALTAGSGRSIVLLSSQTKTADELILSLKGNPDVIGVTKNYKMKAHGKTPDDALWNKQWGPKRIKAPEVWENASVGSEEVYVAVLDMGAIYDHPDLAANISGILPDGTYGRMFHDNGSVTKIVRSGTPSCDVTIKDLSEVDYATVGDVGGHGTHVSGIIGAVGNNEIGVTGINWRVKILPVGVFSVVEKYDENNQKFFDTSAKLADIIGGLDYIVELKRTYGLNIRVANMSLGGWLEAVDQDTDPFAQSVKRASDAGIIVCISAGNDEQDIDNPVDHEGELVYPACFRFENTITVGASNEHDGLETTSGSNYSSSGKWVDIMAPGDNIMSTTPMCSYAGSREYNRTRYASWSGTSMATPMVAGAAALLCAVYPDKSANEIKMMLMNGAENVLREGYSKYGLLNVYNASRTRSGGSGGGGCSAGFALLALAALVPLAAWKRKK
ncbi:MAG: S8 family serine peptidase [Cloacibacillus sp.]|nr:S8 family serine peptidase [Cloacibacillus sp.]